MRSDAGTIQSPRSKYIAGCMQKRLNPRASLVVRKNMTKQLNLQHHGMGDTMAKLLVESIQGLPFIESINIADNMWAHSTTALSAAFRRR